jgi:hypothetical protein
MRSIGEEGALVRVRSYTCRLRGYDHETIVNATSASKARYRYLLDVRGPFPDVTFADIVVRSHGEPHSDEMFEHIARLRGVDFKCGDEVTFGDRRGVVIGAGAGANFEILCEGGETVLVHPAYIEEGAFRGTPIAHREDHKNERNEA